MTTFLIAAHKNEAPMVCGLAADKFTKHNTNNLWNNHYYLKFNVRQMTECTW